MNILIDCHNTRERESEGGSIEAHQTSRFIVSVGHILETYARTLLPIGVADVSFVPIWTSFAPYQISLSCSFLLDRQLWVTIL